jgi:hypothetical protein
MLTVDEALDQIYLGGDRYYRVIDVAIRRLRPEGPVMFARVSGHAPVEYGNTWDPTDLGPFKQLVSQEIETVG